MNVLCTPSSVQDKLIAWIGTKSINPNEIDGVNRPKGIVDDDLEPDLPNPPTRSARGR